MRIMILFQTYYDDERKVFDELFEEIYSVLSLIDVLKLNVKLGL